MESSCPGSWVDNSQRWQVFNHTNTELIENREAKCQRWLTLGLLRTLSRNITQEWCSCCRPRPNSNIIHIFASSLSKKICYLHCDLFYFCININQSSVCWLIFKDGFHLFYSTSEEEGGGREEAGVGGRGDGGGRRGHASCNYHSQVQVTGQVFFFSPTMQRRQGLAHMRHSMPPLPLLWLGVSSSTALRLMLAGSTGMTGKPAEGSIKWQLCYDMSARTWWMVSAARFSSLVLFS